MARGKVLSLFFRWTTGGVLLLVLGLSAAGLTPGSAAAAVGVDERPGQVIAGDIRCATDRGETVPLAALLDRPTILCLVYFRCEHICPQLLVGLGRLVSNMDLRLGADYRILTLSFDSSDTAADAAEAKVNYTRPLGPGIDRKGWTFAAASAGDIERLTNSLGFRMSREGMGFIHPVILVLLAPGGRISRYLHPAKYEYGLAYPVTFSPVEMRQSLEAAKAGTITTGPSRPLLFCFPGEPFQQARYYQVTTVFGLVTLASLALLFVYLTIAGRRSKEGR